VQIRLLQTAERSAEILVEIEGMKATNIIFPGSNGQYNRPISGPRQDKTFIVISVFAN